MFNTIVILNNNIGYLKWYLVYFVNTRSATKLLRNGYEHLKRGRNLFRSACLNVLVVYKVFVVYNYVMDLTRTLLGVSKNIF